MSFYCTKFILKVLTRKITVYNNKYFALKIDNLNHSTCYYTNGINEMTNLDVDRNSVLLRDILVGNDLLEEDNENELSSFLGKNAACCCL